MTRIIPKIHDFKEFVRYEVVMGMLAFGDDAEDEIVIPKIRKNDSDPEIFKLRSRVNYYD